MGLPNSRGMLVRCRVSEQDSMIARRWPVARHQLRRAPNKWTIRRGAPFYYQSEERSPGEAGHYSGQLSKTLGGPGSRKANRPAPENCRARLQESDWRRMQLALPLRSDLALSDQNRASCG